MEVYPYALIDEKAPTQSILTPNIVDKNKGSNFYPAISVTFLPVCKFNRFYRQVHSFCKFCIFADWTL